MEERDPVCGMKLKPGQEDACISYSGHNYCFCSVECKQMFEKNPKQYIAEMQASSSNR